jgi:hypothetical protein
MKVTSDATTPVIALSTANVVGQRRTIRFVLPGAALENRQVYPPPKTRSQLFSV